MSFKRLSLNITPLALGLWISLNALAGCALPAPAGEPPVATPTAAAKATSPTATAVISQANAPTPAATAALPTAPAPDLAAPATPSQSASPTVTPLPTPGALGLVCGDESGVFWIDPGSGELLPLLAAPLSNGWALRDNALALVRGRLVEIVDLATGQAALLPTDLPENTAEARLIWGATSDTLLLTGWIEPDPDADEPRQQIVFQELRPNGDPTAAIAYDGPPAMLMGYDGAAQQALLWHPTSSGGEIEVLAIDLTTGQTELLTRLSALSEVSLGPSGAVAALATSAGGYQIVVAPGTDEEPLALPLASGAYATQLVWSPGGERLAYLLRRGELYEPETELLGLYVFELAAGVAHGPLITSLTEAQIAGWSPDGQSIGVRGQRDGAPYYALVGRDGAGERLLPVRGNMTYLGWLPRPSLASTAPALDAWRGRFVAAAGDATATAAAAASFVAANPDLSLDERATRIAAYYAAAGWPTKEWRLIALDESLVVLEAPPASILLAVEGVAQVIGQGQTLAAARLAGEQLAVIYGSEYSGARQWSAALLRRQQGQWQTVWQPLGQLDWVATDGAVQYIGAGIAGLRVTGSSRGLPADAFVECAACPARQLAATWSLQSDGYLRETALPPSASAADVYWEMTERTPYAIVYEAVRRLRAGQPVGDLATSAAAAQLAQLELAGPEVRLMISSVSPEAVTFGPATAPDSYRATVSNGQITAVSLLPR